MIKYPGMFYQQLYWLCDCDSTELAVQMMKILDIKGERKRRLERLMCEKSSPGRRGCPSGLR